MRTLLSVLLVGILLMASSVVLSAEPTASDVQQALIALTPSHAEEIMSAFSLGFAQGRLQVASTLHMINRLIGYEGEQGDKEGILITVAHTLQDALPVVILVEKAEEGMARSVPLALILNGAKGQPPILGLTQREYLLSATRDTLYSKGIFSTPPGAKATSQSLSLVHFDTLVSEIADSLADYVESGGSPLEGHLLYQQVSDRLTDLAGLKVPIVQPEDTRLVLERVTPADLTTVVLKIFE
ncbi:MAG: hypothetical protein U9Q94_00720 [Candidatus Bipolaricaulota bacterium]|nr:hypothetical protein [Candidatus Bipolaricaulota bacterium]